jgi:uncharacterized protein YacL (UPF0231 family)
MSMLSPLDNIRPSDIMSQYSEWIYFTLILIFFISIAGLTLRKHFDRPYVKPLIISVGLMMTAGVFMMREKVAMIFQGWGILGTLLLVFIAATIPYGLCRGFGMQANRAFYVVYALFYILSWAKFPDAYYYLGDHNMGLVNLGLLILFVVAIYKIVTMWKSKTDLSRSLNIDSPAKKEIVQEMDMQGVERKALEREENKATKFEIKTIKDIEESLVEMIRIIQTSNANLNSQDRGRISETLKKISSKEDIFLKTIQNLKQLLQRLRVLDAKQIQEMKNRLARSNGKEKEALEKEIFMEVEKIKIEQNVIALEQKLEQGMNYFNNLLRQAVQVLNSTAYPADAVQHLSQARMGLKDTFSIIDEMRRFEDKLIQLTKNEKRLLKDEKNKA